MTLTDQRAEPAPTATRPLGRVLVTGRRVRSRPRRRGRGRGRGRHPAAARPGRPAHARGDPRLADAPTARRRPRRDPRRRGRRQRARRGRARRRRHRGGHRRLRPDGGGARRDWDRVVQVNLLGTAAVVRAALPALQASRGRIVTVASTLGLRALSDASAYCASKFGVVGLTRALATELRARSASPCSSRAAWTPRSSTAAPSSTGRARARCSTTRARWPTPCCTRFAGPRAARCAS